MSTERKPSYRLKLLLLFFAAVLLAALIVVFLIWGLPALSEAKQPKPVLKGKDCSLSNEAFAFYYWNEYMYCLNSGEQTPFDPDTPLSQQAYDDTLSWEDYLIRQALSSAEQTLAFVRAAQLAGFSLPEEYQSSLDSQLEGCLQQAEYAQMTPDAYFESLYGAGATQEGFQEYLTNSYLATTYTDELYDSFCFTSEQLDEFYAQNQTLFEGSDTILDDVHPCSLRCIFLVPSGEGESLMQETKDSAEMLFTEWKKDPTEEAFKKLADVYNQDTAADADGLYRDVCPGQAEQCIDDWCFAPERKAGDCTLLELENGYVLLFYSAQAPLSRRQLACDAELRYEAYRSAVTQLVEDCSFILFPERVVLHDPSGLK